jgi:ribosomal protein L21E
MTDTKPPATHQVAGDTAAKGTEERVRQLFRRTLREGRLHPLQHLIQRHRSSGAT